VRLRREAGRPGDGAGGGDAAGLATDQLVVEVWDDGQGGATILAGSGLAGLESRVTALDGRLSISSPKGGPTVVRAELPLAAAAPTS